MASSESDFDCCPPFEPTEWDDQTFNWINKPFIRDKVCTMFYMPLNFGSVIKRMNKKVEESGASIPDWLCLSDHTSRWNMDVYLAVDREISGVANTALSGKFYSKVYEGPFRDTEKWCNDFESLAQTKGFNIRKWYMWYTTCPKCAKKYGKNYVVVIGQVE